MKRMPMHIYIHLKEKASKLKEASAWGAPWQSNSLSPTKLSHNCILNDDRTNNITSKLQNRCYVHTHTLQSSSCDAVYHCMIWFSVQFSDIHQYSITDAVRVYSKISIFFFFRNMMGHIDLILLSAFLSVSMTSETCKSHFKNTLWKDLFCRNV